MMCFCFPRPILFGTREMGQSVTENLSMKSIDLPEALSPCVRTFLEILCSELNGPDGTESRGFVSRAVKRPQTAAQCAPDGDRDRYEMPVFAAST